jgi:hypothetical protein
LFGWDSAVVRATEGTLSLAVFELYVTAYCGSRQIEVMATASAQATLSARTPSGARRFAEVGPFAVAYDGDSPHPLIFAIISPTPAEFASGTNAIIWRVRELPTHEELVWDVERRSREVPVGVTRAKEAERLVEKTLYKTEYYWHATTTIKTQEQMANGKLATIVQRKALDIIPTAYTPEA